MGNGNRSSSSGGEDKVIPCLLLRNPWLLHGQAGGRPLFHAKRDAIGKEKEIKSQSLLEY